VDVSALRGDGVRAVPDGASVRLSGEELALLLVVGITAVVGFLLIVTGQL